MAGLNQNLSQKQLQKLSPQQIQLMKLLQIPTATLEQRIKEELEANPALDEGEDFEEEVEHLSAQHQEAVAAGHAFELQSKELAAELSEVKDALVNLQDVHADALNSEEELKTVLDCIEEQKALVDNELGRLRDVSVRLLRASAMAKYGIYRELKSIVEGKQG